MMFFIKDLHIKCDNYKIPFRKKNFFEKRISSYPNVFTRTLYPESAALIGQIGPLDCTYPGPMLIGHNMLIIILV